MGFSFRNWSVRTLAAAAIVLAGTVVLPGYFLTDTSVAQDLSSGVRVADPVEVCMVNDKVMGRPQIPVEFEGKTYYGCCQGCVARIKFDRSVRYAVDPVSGKVVDKASAVILEGPGGEALYFESLDTAGRFSSGK